GFAAMGLGSDFFGLRLFGTLMPAAMAISCIAALSVMPVLVLRTRPAFVFGPRAAGPEPAAAAATSASQPGPARRPAAGAPSSPRRVRAAAAAAGQRRARLPDPAAEAVAARLRHRACLALLHAAAARRGSR